MKQQSFGRFCKENKVTWERRVSNKDAANWNYNVSSRKRYTTTRKTHYFIFTKVLTYQTASNCTKVAWKMKFNPWRRTHLALGIICQNYSLLVRNFSRNARLNFRFLAFLKTAIIRIFVIFAKNIIQRGGRRTKPNHAYDMCWTSSNRNLWILNCLAELSIQFFLT